MHHLKGMGQKCTAHPRSIENIHVATCTIDRDCGADERRMLSLRGVDTKEGYDLLMNGPMAMVAISNT